MKKTVWIINHYANHMYFSKGGRHYSFAKYLKENGYEPIVFCSNAKHNEYGTYFRNDVLFTVKNADEIDVPFVFVKSRPYKGNGKQRVFNMIDFYHNVKKTIKIYKKNHGKPDVLYASSVHPLTLIAGIELAKSFGIKCICEVRDLWPESIVAYSNRWSKDDLLIKILYQGEKWIYKRSDHIIMTWPGGYNYIEEKGWNEIIPNSKVTHISNGVDLQEYELNKNKVIKDIDLDDSKHVKFIYTGSIRQINNLSLILNACTLLKKRGNNRAKILIYGEGEERNSLEERAKARKLDNIKFKGQVDKESIPSILQSADITLLHNTSTILDRFGQSQNKFFEYLAAGKPILMTYSVGNSINKKNHCGIELNEQTAESIADAIDMFCGIESEEYMKYSANSITTSKMFDYKRLTEKLIYVIEHV